MQCATKIGDEKVIGFEKIKSHSDSLLLRIVSTLIYNISPKMLTMKLK